MLRCLLLAAGLVPLGALAAAAQEAPPRLSLPVLCEIGVECFVQQYVDAHPGPIARDHLCGSLAYDGHDGTDFRVATLADMARGVPVVAAAPGTVRAVRDGEPDAYLDDRGREAVRGREAGNAVLIDHLGGWATQYNHLKQGSVLVRPGQRVGAGQVLGLIGLSGMAEFPHVEFRLFRGERRIDPFTGLQPESGCRRGGRPLWDEDAAQALVYRAGGLLAAGFAGRPVDTASIEAGAWLGVERLAADAEALLFWVLDYGLQAGDRLRLEILGPDGGLFVEQEETLERDKPEWTAFLGRRRGEAPWPGGLYEARHLVVRNGVAVVDARRRLTVE